MHVMQTVLLLTPPKGDHFFLNFFVQAGQDPEQKTNLLLI